MLGWIVVLSISRMALQAGAGAFNLSLSTLKEGRMRQDTTKAPTVAVEERVVSPMIFLAIRDTAASQADMARIFGRDYGELYTYAGQNGLKPGRAMARYYSVQPVYIFDVAIEVDKVPGGTGDRLRADSSMGGNAVIAHFKGPYEQIGMAYAAIQKWLRANDRTACGQPFEIYLNNPASVPDPYDLRTDIYQLTSAARQTAGQVLELR